MSFKTLKECIKIASKDRKKEKDNKKYYICAITKRFDGTYTQATNARCPTKTPSFHAEYRALSKSGKGAILWVGRVLADGSWGMAKPCSSCMKFIRNMNVKKVYYTIQNNEYGVIKL